MTPKINPKPYWLNPDSGTSLVEIILYVGLTATILLGISVLIATALESRVRSQVVNEVESQGLIAAQIISQSIRNAIAINSPIVGSSSSTLSLRMNAAPINPTIYTIATGTLQITEAANPPIALTNSKIQVTALNFSNLSHPGTPGVIHFQFALTYLNPQNRAEYVYSKTFISSVSIR